MLITQSNRYKRNKTLRSYSSLSGIGFDQVVVSVRTKLDSDFDFLKLTKDEQRFRVYLETYHSLQTDASIVGDCNKFLSNFNSFDKLGYKHRSKLLSTISAEEKTIWFKHRRNRLEQTYRNREYRITRHFKSVIKSAMAVRLERLATNEEYRFDSLWKRESTGVQGSGRCEISTVSSEQGALE